MKKKSISNSLSHSQWRSENSIFHPKITMVRELEVKKKNGRRRAAASGLINFSTLSKFFFPFCRHHHSSSMKKRKLVEFAVQMACCRFLPIFHTNFTLEIYYSCLNFYFELKGTFCHVLLLPSRISLSSTCFFYFQKLFLMSSELAEIDNIHFSIFCIHRTSLKCALHIFF